MEQLNNKERESMITLINELNQRAEKASAELKAVNDAIKALRDICQHDYVPAGNDSHYYYEECTICNHRIKI